MITETCACENVMYVQWFECEISVGVGNDVNHDVLDIPSDLTPILVATTECCFAALVCVCVCYSADLDSIGISSVINESVYHAVVKQSSIWSTWATRRRGTASFLHDFVDVGSILSICLNCKCNSANNKHCMDLSIPRALVTWQCVSLKRRDDVQNSASRLERHSEGYGCKKQQIFSQSITGWLCERSVSGWLNTEAHIEESGYTQNILVEVDSWGKPPIDDTHILIALQRSFAETWLNVVLISCCFFVF